MRGRPLIGWGSGAAREGKPRWGLVPPQTSPREEVGAAPFLVLQRRVRERRAAQDDRLVPVAEADVARGLGNSGTKPRRVYGGLR